MRHFTLSLLIGLLSTAICIGQQDFAGEYIGDLYGERVTLVLASDGPARLTGLLRDSEQEFKVAAVTDFDKLTGTASEPQSGMTFELSAVLSGSTLSMQMSLRGVAMAPITVIFRREGMGSAPAAAGITGMPDDGLHRDPVLVGAWRMDEQYSSGYGDQYFSGATSSTIGLGPDGRVYDGGSSAMIGGSNYTGQSTGQGAGEVAGVRWYSRGNQIWLRVEAQGQVQDVKLGRYYVEDGKLLITPDEGKRMLLYRQ